MNDTEKTCSVCHGGRRRPRTVIFTVDLGSSVLVVRQVPAQVCDLCGADWIEDSIAEKLETMVEQARRRHPVVEVADWADKAAAASV